MPHKSGLREKTSQRSTLCASVAVLQSLDTVQEFGQSWVKAQELPKGTEDCQARHGQGPPHRATKGSIPATHLRSQVWYLRLSRLEKAFVQEVTLQASAWTQSCRLQS